MKRLPQGRYSREFRLEAVKLVTEEHLGIKASAEKLTLPVTTLATLVSPVVSGQIVKLFGIEYAFYAASVIVLIVGILIIFRFK